MFGKKELAAQSSRLNCYWLTFLQITYVLYCHISFTLHVYHLGLISGGGWDGGIVKGDNAGKQVTAVRVGASEFVNEKLLPEPRCSTFVSVTPACICKETSGHIQARL